MVVAWDIQGTLEESKGTRPVGLMYAGIIQHFAVATYMARVYGNQLTVHPSWLERVMVTRYCRLGLGIS